MPLRHSNLLSKLPHARILVAGDVMLDRYWFSEVERISPEAPVPVAKVGRTEDRPGGAANVARNIAALGGQATLLSVIGADEPGQALSHLLSFERIKTYLKTDPTISTTIKLRVIARHQQLLRIDFETPPSHEVLAAKLDEYVALLPDTDVVILSDYGKGGLKHVARMIKLAREQHKPVLVDPKGDDYRSYSGATLLTPNLNEFRQVAGGWRSEEELTEKAQHLRQKLQLEALLITRSEEGMNLYREEGVLHQPAQAREVFDVSGAGDTVIATLGLMLASGCDMAQAVALANRAASIVVGKLGTAVVEQHELF